MNATINKAEAVANQLAAVNLDSVPVVATDRCIPRKEQAALTRKLFRQLGVKGISVTTPNYSMAQAVEIRLPKFERDYALEVSEDPAVKLNFEARNKLEAILTKAFPNHDDRSDFQSDYFDYCWMID